MKWNLSGYTLGVIFKVEFMYNNVSTPNRTMIDYSTCC